MRGRPSLVCRVRPHGCHSEVASRQRPQPTGRLTIGIRDSSYLRSVPIGTTRISSFGTSGPAPANISHSSRSQRAASVMRCPERAGRFVVAVAFSGTGQVHGSRSHLHTGSFPALHGAVIVWNIDGPFELCRERFEALRYSASGSSRMQPIGVPLPNCYRLHVA
jgi:hypothetical protein